MFLLGFKSLGSGADRMHAMISNLASELPKLGYLFLKTGRHFDGVESPVVFLLRSSSMTKDLMKLLLAAATEVMMASLIN